MELTYSILIPTIIISQSFAFVIWLYCIKYIARTLKKSATSVSLNNIKDPLYKVSIILPIRCEEEEDVRKCMESLVDQRYGNYEIIAVYDSDVHDQDRSVHIILDYHARYPEKIIVVRVGSRPKRWTGKNWACYQGYLKSTGSIILFTDSDTIHSPSSMYFAVSLLIEHQLDALTARPHIICKGIWSNIIFPIVWSFHLAKYSPSRLSTSSKTGFSFGSFLLIKRSVYEAVGTHGAVKNYIIEDIAIGEILKNKKFNIKMFLDGQQQQVYQIVKGNLHTWWNALKRTTNVIPFFDHSRSSNRFLMTLIVLVVLLQPFITLAVSPFFLTIFDYNPQSENVWKVIATVIMLSTNASIIVAHVMQSKICVVEKSLYALAAPLAAIIISAAFLTSIFNVSKTNAVNWRGRSYRIDEGEYILK
jgi:chlorobactene glucosyltransferase